MSSTALRKLRAGDGQTLADVGGPAAKHSASLSFDWIGLGRGLPGFLWQPCTLLSLGLGARSGARAQPVPPPSLPPSRAVQAMALAKQTGTTLVAQEVGEADGLCQLRIDMHPP